MKRSINIAYIGGGSKEWARVFMNDLALTADLYGKISLYDTDTAAALRNKRIGDRINESALCKSRWEYEVASSLADALRGADAVIISILPGTFREMQSDVHAPEAFSIYQTVGDTAGPGGVLRAMRTVPAYVDFARAIADVCPDAWVLNLTNPMSVCTGALYNAFPRIKAFGCCHEVFHAQDFLSAVYAETTGEPRPERDRLTPDVCGVNHFTWITRARFGGTDILSMLPGFIDKYFDAGYCANTPGDPREHERGDLFQCGNKVKMDLFRRFGALAAAGDRHLVEFMDRSWYLKSPEPFGKWGFYRTPVDYRVVRQRQRIEESEKMAKGQLPVTPKRSSEEVCDLLRAIFGCEKRVSNVNMQNVGQTPQLALGSIVETNCVFAEDSVSPVTAAQLPAGAAALVRRAADNNDALTAACVARDTEKCFEVFMNQPLCAGLSQSEGEALFMRMFDATRGCLDGYRPL